MATADAFRGLAEIDYSIYAPDNPADKVRAAFPTFRTFVPAGGSIRDEVVLLRASVAQSHARAFVSLGGTVDENDIPAVFRAINPAGDATTCGFPTFTYGQNTSGRYMNVIELKSGFRRVPAPVGTAGLSDLTMVETACAAAHTFALAGGFAAGFPTFRTVAGGGAEIVVFTSPSPGVVVFNTLSVGVGTPVPWTFRTLPVLSDGAFAMTSDGVDPIVFHVVDDVVGAPGPDPQRNLFEFVASTPAMTAPIDPDAAGNRQAAFLEGQCSAVTTGGTVHAIYCNGALTHVSHAVGTPTTLSFRIASGRNTPNPPGIVGFYNCLAVAPNGTLHALAYLSVPPGTVPGPPINEATEFNVLHLSFDGTTWTEETVDGSGMGTTGSALADTGQTLSMAFEPDGTAHAFYLMRLSASAAPDGFVRRLRHAELRPAGWVCETLDGAGSSSAPPAPGTGPIRADVGLDSTAVFFDGALWVIYEDRTNGNLRSARGKRDTNGTLLWTFQLLDGNARRGSTGGVVQAAAAVVCDDTLSVFYADETADVIRHAFRAAGATAWRFEVLDGAGGPDGRLHARMAQIVTAVAAGRKPDGSPTRPLFVGYRMYPAPGNTRLRVATRM